MDYPSQPNAEKVWDTWKQKHRILNFHKGFPDYFRQSQKLFDQTLPLKNHGL